MCRRMLHPSWRASWIWTWILALMLSTTSRCPCRPCVTCADGNVCQCHCEPGVAVEPRNRDAEAGRRGEGDCGRDGVPQETRDSLYLHQQYAMSFSAESLFSHRLSPASTNDRVQNFAWFSIFSLAALGVWQVLHLRSYFKRKYLID